MVVLAAALLVGASSASAALSARSVCGARCGTLEASNASGALTMAANGDVWGRIGKGVILLLDRSNPGSRGWSVSSPGGPLRGTRVAGTNWFRYSGRNLSFSAYHKWTIKIRKASGIYLTAVAAGWVRLPVRGTFTRNGIHIRGGARYALHS
jgi:hypothetical protein